MNEWLGPIGYSTKETFVLNCTIAHTVIQSSQASFIVQRKSMHGHPRAIHSCGEVQCLRSNCSPAVRFWSLLHGQRINLKYNLTEKCLRSAMVFGPCTSYISTTIESSRRYNIHRPIYQSYPHYHILDRIRSFYAQCRLIMLTKWPDPIELVVVTI